MTVLDQVAEMLLQRVSADTRQFDRIANRDAPVLAGNLSGARPDYAAFVHDGGVATPHSAPP